MGVSDLGRYAVQIGKAMRVVVRRGLAPRLPLEPLPSWRGHPRLRRDGAGRPLCTACGACLDACPTRCLRLEEAGGAAHLRLDWTRCMSCGLCASACPVGALELASGAQACPIVSRGEEGPAL